MSELSITLKWNRSETELIAGKFSNSHHVVFNDNYDFQVDAAQIGAETLTILTQNKL